MMSMISPRSWRTALRPPLDPRGTIGRLAARAAARGQGGFALMSVMAVIALTAVVLVALLGLLIATIRATTAQETAARELRAADGAIESAIAQMRANPSASSADPCAVDGFDAVEEVTFDQDTPSPGDDVTAVVECQIDVVGDDSGAAGDQVRIVGGDAYQGDVAWTTDCGGAGPGCFPWSGATGSVPGGLAGSGSTLVHSGPEALRFNSGVTVKRGAAALRNPVDGSPAIRVAGQYLQGQPGLMSGDDGCGLLDGSVGTEAGRIEDLDGAPTCNDAGARDVFTSPTDARAGLPIPDTPVGSVPSCSGSTITFPAGRYDAARTAQVSALLNGSSCTGKTFHFPGPVYYFDAAAGLSFGDSTSTYVFGDLGGATLCDRGQSGASVVISARTEIRHTGGRVAICPLWDGTGTPYPAIYQETSVPNQPVFVSASSGHFKNVGNIGTNPDSSVFSHDNDFTCDTFQSPCNTRNRTFTTRWSSPGTGPLTSVIYSIVATEKDPANLVERRTARITARTADGRQCTHDFAGLSNSYQRASYDLLTPGSACIGVLNDHSDLDGLQITVRPIFRMGTFLNRVEYRVKAVGLRSNVWSGSAGSASARNGEWANPSNAIADDAQSAVAALSCAATVCEQPGGERVDEYQLRTSGIDVEVPGTAAGVSGARVTSLYADVKVDAPSYFSPLIPGNGIFLPTGWYRLDLRSSAGINCTVSYGGHINSSQTMSFDLLHPSGSCASQVDSVDQLDGAEVDLTVGVDCQPDLINPKCWEVRPPSIQHLELAVTSDAYSGPPPTSVLTIDSDAGSSFNAFGKAWMPVSDLDIHWRGGVTPESLFGGELVLHGLGSDMAPDAQMGAVCCSVHQPDSRTVDLVAKVNGEDRLRVKVRFQDRDPDTGDYSPGHSVIVIDYRTCRRGGCGPNEPDPGP